MNSTRIIALAISLIMIFSLISCDQLHFHTGGNNYNPHNQQQNQGHDQSQNNTEGGEGNVTYVYSVLSKVIHLPDCYHVKNIKDDYLIEYKGDITVLLQKKYTICRDCLVPDEEPEEDDTEEDENLIAKEDATYATHKVKKVVHLINCYTLESMSQKNLRYTDLSFEELLALEYRPCGTCMPEEYAQYKKDHPDEFEE